MPPAARKPKLTVAVTGPTGDIGRSLLRSLEQSGEVGRVVAMARRPFDPAAEGLGKTEYRQGDVLDRAGVEELLRGVDVVIHLAFLIMGRLEETQRVNLEGSRNVFEAAVAAGAQRLVYASSVAAYGFHADNPVGMTEEWPVRPAARLFYAQEKAELEVALRAEAAQSPGPALYLLRPSVVLGPHAVGGKSALPGPLGQLSRLARWASRFPVPVLVPALPLQLVHEEDMGRALMRCVVADGPPGAYNIAADGIVTAADVARELGLLAVPLPAGPAQAAARAAAAVPWLPPVVGWVEAASHPAIMDTTRAKRQLGWAPRFTALETVRDTLRGRELRSGHDRDEIDDRGVS
jgi:nucleoside-diphosphate-sugar epimerase